LKPHAPPETEIPHDRLTTRFIENHGRECAYIPFARWQRIFYCVVPALLCLLLPFRWDLCILGLTAWASLWYLAAALFKGIAALRSLRGDGIESPTSEELAALTDEELPVYTILVPLYHEANIAEKIVHSIERLDYPAEKLDVKLLLEADDHETQEAVASCDLPSCCEVMVVPDGLPRTKPRACNYGLEGAGGEFCVIFDAEDQPDPDQLRKAVAAFSKLPKKVACLQAALNYFNAHQNWLTRWFTIEYSTTFDLYLPGVQTMGVPVPLGGTSNHFRTEVLRKVGGWDPFNVTEDCDLGIRLYKYHYTTRMLDSTTWEEANSRTWNWVRQRSRWVKGFLQTHLVHMRHPVDTARQLGVRGMVGFYLAVGATSFMMITNVFYWLLGLVYMGLLWHGHRAGETFWSMMHGPHAVELYRGIPLGGVHVRAWPLLFSGPNEARAWVVLSVSLFIVSVVLLSANLFLVLIHVIACIRRRYYRLIPMALLMPFYWILVSVGAWKGGLQLLTRPFYWEKTIHGLDTAKEPLVKRLSSWVGRRSKGATAALLVLLTAGTLEAREAGWYTGSDAPTKVAAAEAATVEAEVADGGVLFLQHDIHTFRAAREAFAAASIAIAVADVSAPVVARLFVQDHDSVWFQTRQSWRLVPGEPVTLSASLSRFDHAFEPQGHAGQWHVGHAVDMITVGLSFEPRGEDAEAFVITTEAPRLTGERQRRELRVAQWELPGSVPQRRMSESRFDLTREYFNPFDPEEIRVDVEIVDPSGKQSAHPAFFGVDCRRALVVGHEQVTPAGMPYWAYRFTPELPGTYRHRLQVTEVAAGVTNRVTTPWRDCDVQPDEARGFVTVDPDYSDYFRFDNGELFYPIGLNLHAMFDPRGSGVLGKGKLPDYGTYSFDDYFAQMHRHGLTAAEIWMASWSMGLEWSSERRGYRGVGRYNMLNAWRLDHLLATAGQNGIYLHLTLDNHGKVALKMYDPEWPESPYNAKAPFAVADGGFLDAPNDFFSNTRALELNAQRNRYIVARWGQNPAIFGVELWSEGNLIDNYGKLYNSGTIVEWTRQVCDDLRAAGLRQLLTTHFDEDYKSNLKYIKLGSLPQIDYIVGDAYRDGGMSMLEQLTLQDEKLRQLRKPRLITEYGGSWRGTSHPGLEADLHAGLWGSFFARQAGTPMLWWHAYIHYECGYGHYLGFANFIKGEEPRREGYAYKAPRVIAGKDIEARAAGTATDRLLWVATRAAMRSYPTPEKRASLPVVPVTVELTDLQPGRFLVQWWDTLEGVRSEESVVVAEDGRLRLVVPALQIDVAAKISRQVEKGGAQ